MGTMEPITLTFEFERETKNTNRYNEKVVGDAKPIIGSLYINRSALPEGDVGPRTVTLS